MLPQADEISPWTSQSSGNDPWPPESWQPESARQGRRADLPQDERPWAAQDAERPWAYDEERPWAEPPQERQQAERPWAEQPAQTPGQRPWEVEFGQQQQQQPWNAGQQPQRPWDAPPQEQPRPYRPEAEQWLPDDGPRWRGPLLAGLVAALLTAAIVVGYVFWTKDNTPDTTVSQPGTSLDSGESPKDDAKDESEQIEDPAVVPGDAKSEAKAFDGLLGDMTESRKKLSNITYTCANKSKDIATFKNAIQEREGQLADANSLSVSSLTDGDSLKSALLDALQASIDSNKEALTWLQDEDGCDGDAAARLKDVTDKATATKRAFLDLWNPIATEQGLQTRTRETI